MAISFNNIPAGIRVPLFYAEVDASQAGTGQRTYKGLVIGQKHSTGSAAENNLQLVSGIDQARTLFGTGAMLTSMVDMYRRNDPFGELWAIAVPDHGSGVAATGNVTFSGTADATGSVKVMVAGQPVIHVAANGDTAADVATAVTAKINADDSLLVTATAGAGAVTLTARHVGEESNGIDLRVYFDNQSGSGFGLSAAITGMSGGAQNPDVASALAAVGDEPFDAIVLPYSDTANLDALQAFMDDTTGRWSYVQQLYGHVYAARTDTLAGLQTFGAGRNDQHMSIMGVHGSATVSWNIAAAFGAQSARSLAIDPARPLQTLPLIGVQAPSESDRFTISERNTLLYAGLSTMSFADGAARIERAITTYQQNSWGEPDNSYLDVTTLSTLAYVLNFLRGRITQKFPRHKLANDGTRFGAGQAVVTPNVIRGELVAAYGELERLAIVENMDAFKNNLIVERDQVDPNRINVLYPPDLVNQLRVFAVLAQFRLQYSAAA